jgi:hypothetical protein
VLVMDCTATGRSPPIVTEPIRTGTERRLGMDALPWEPRGIVMVGIDASLARREKGGVLDSPS